MSFTQPRHGAGGEAAAGLNCAADHPRMNKALAPKKSILKTTHGSRKKKCVRFSDPTAGISEMQDITLCKMPENPDEDKLGGGVIECDSKFAQPFSTDVKRCGINEIEDSLAPEEALMVFEEQVRQQVGAMGLT